MDPNVCASELTDALRQQCAVFLLANDLLGWIRSGGFLPSEDVLEELEGALGYGYNLSREDLCSKLQGISGENDV